MKKSYKRLVKKTGRRVYKATGLVNPIKKGKLSLSRVIKDVSIIKKALNTEKKTYDQPIEDTSFSVGQITSLTATTFTSGHYIRDITPIPAQGITAETRNGDSIKLVSMFIKMQFYQMTGSISKIQGYVEIIQVVGLPINNMATALANYLQPNDFIKAQTGTDVYDINAARDIDAFKCFRTLRKVPFSLKADSTTSDNVIRNLTLGLKLNHHVKFDKNTTTVSNGQLIMLVRLDSGNNGNTTLTSNPASIPVVTAFSGLRFSYYVKQYFVDN